MTPQDMRERVARFRGLAKQRSHPRADEVVALARQLEKAADDPERAEGQSGTG